ncbi:hypothetical protein [Nocardia sp. NPDC051832]|uniref:hypothetical protein n=1 Tax=Nocardia sp. NPDC051832 TaxID=3155673 RepID=UPI003424311A
MPENSCEHCGRVRRDRVLNIRQISDRTGHTPDRIRHLRVTGHPLYSQAWKAGDASNSPLLLEASVVEEWVKSRRGLSL